MARNGTSKVPYSNTSVAETPNLAKGTHVLSVSASGSIGFDGGISPRLLSSVAPHLARRWFLRSRLRASLENAGNPPCKKEPSLNYRGRTRTSEYISPYQSSFATSERRNRIHPVSSPKHLRRIADVITRAYIDILRVYPSMGPSHCHT